ncbi:interleukin-21 receptor-like [Spea bombifrons]|uniref:interleukin-21 receptor-like n=1 Tax=Spea bombifrons TaxID=233779 RepID=UPI00234A3E95|nr:interleukin-21 receptor-like [Spea bombifrons]
MSYAGMMNHHKIKMNRKHDIYPSPLLFILCFIVPITKTCEDLTCYVDYIHSLSCTVVNNEGDKPGISYHLSATWTTEDEEQGSCQLVQSSNKHQHICILDMDLLGADDTYCISISKTINGENITTKCGPYRFSGTFRPTAPFNLSVSVSEKTYNFSWRTEYEGVEHMFQHGEIGYELSFKKDGDAWANHRSINIIEDEKSVSLLKIQFQENEDYVARVRAKPRNTSVYKGSWSDWGPSVTWRTEVDEYNRGVWGSLHWMILLCLGIFIAILLLFPCIPLKLRTRIFKNMCGFVPNPAHFFKPLYVGHSGDFKSWLGTSYYATVLHFDCVAVPPEILEICSQNLCQRGSKPGLYDTENHEKLLPKTCCNIHIHDCRKSRGSASMRSAHNERVSIDTVTVIDDGTPCCPQCISDNGPCVNANMDNEEINSDDGYPPVTLDSGSCDILDDVQSKKSHSNVKPSKELELDLQENLRQPNVNFLDLIAIPPEEWQLQDSLSQDDENVFYNDEPFDPFSPGSGNSEDFGYPRMCLDLDTIDSGFVDSDCGSPVESEFGNRDISIKSPSSQFHSGQEECKRNYVKQWVPSNTTTAGGSNNH